jgi:hypothetical protein
MTKRPGNFARTRGSRLAYQILISSLPLISSRCSVRPCHSTKGAGSSKQTLPGRQDPQTTTFSLGYIVDFGAGATTDNDDIVTPGFRTRVDLCSTTTDCQICNWRHEDQTCFPLSGDGGYGVIPLGGFSGLDFASMVATKVRWGVVGGELVGWCLSVFGRG